MKQLGRRDFLKGCGALSAGMLLGCDPISCSAGGGEGGVDKPGEAAAGSIDRRPEPLVIHAEDPRVFKSAADLDEARAARMVHESLMRLTGEKKKPAAWRRIAGPGKKVAVKLNCLAGRGLSPRKAVVDAVVDGLVSAGVSPDDIILFERSDADLTGAGYKIKTGGRGVKCFGHDSLRQAYEPRPLVVGEIGSCFSTIVTRWCDVLVNVGVLKDHDLAGVSVGMKNLYGVIHNPNKYHDNSCDPYVADVALAGPVRDKLKLVLVDATTAQCHGGPAYKPRWCWPMGAVIASFDQVALDAWGAKLIEEQRRKKGLPTLAEAKRAPKWLGTATRLGLGESDLGKVKVERI